MPDKTWPLALCLGEIVYDWISPKRGLGLAEAVDWMKTPGGAPANTAVALARLGVHAGVLGSISDDELGLGLRSIIEKNGVDVTGIVVVPGTQTRMAFIITTEDGDRPPVAFSKICCADEQLEPRHLPVSMFQYAHVLHFGSIPFISEPTASATMAAIELAHASGMLVSYDPNVRLRQWPSEAACRQCILDTLALADIVKINKEELAFLAGTVDVPIEEKAQEFRQCYNLPLLLVTLDSEGALIVRPSGSTLVPAFGIELVEATGAGDAFDAGIISGVIEHLKRHGKTGCNRREIVRQLTEQQLVGIVRTANAIGALACTKIGAMTALPTKAELEEFLSKQG